MLKKEFQYYLDNQQEIVSKYSGKFVIIKDQIIKGSFDSHGEAYEYATKNFEIGSFLIQHCIPGVDSYTQTFHTRAIFYQAH